MELCSKTSVALAQKLDNLNRNLNILFKELNVNAVIRTTQVTPSAAPASAATTESKIIWR